jgi:hypothetical protein
MPLGISESTIAKAYGPQDFSGVYKNLQGSMNKLYAEEKAYRQQNSREFAQTSSKMAEAQKGARHGDMNDIMKATNEWRSLTKMRDSDPRLIEKDPEKWAQYQNKIDEAYSTAMSLAKESSEFANEHKAFGQKIAENPHLYKDNALQDWTKVKDMSLAEIKKQKLDDPNSYLSETPNYDKFLEGFEKKAKAVDMPITEKFGSGIRQIDVKNVPVYGQYFNAAKDAITSQGGIKKGMHFAEKYLQDAQQNGEVEDVINKFNKIASTKGDKKRIGLPENLTPDHWITDINQDLQKNGVATTAAKFMAMKKFVNDYDAVSVKTGPGTYASQEQAQIAAANRGLAKQKELFTWKKGQLEKLGNVSGLVDRLGSNKEDTKSEFVNKINTSGVLAEGNYVHFIKLPRAKMDEKGKFINLPKDEKGIYKASNKIIEELGFKGKQVSTDDVVKKMNEENSNDYSDFVVTQESLNNGNIVSVPYISKTTDNGVTTQQTKHVYLDVGTPEGRNKMKNILNPKFESKSQMNKELGMSESGFFDNVGVK